ncbi:MAG: UDP-galactopyranose mutase [Lentisphaerae bacterium]|nr:MAG: UDP-galactopyranose mutase [Lentisphaerota bacterium]
MGNLSDIAVVGAGFSGTVLAYKLAEAGCRVTLFEERNHLGGNSYSRREPQTGVMVHHYGPHIFHTANEEVWQFINRFTRMMPYLHRVRTTVRGKVYLLPINLLTLNQFFGKAMRPEEARQFVASLAEPATRPAANFEEQALQMVGRELYETFFRGYTRKQWGREPTELPAWILKRLPLRFTYHDSYYNHPYQGIPKDGYVPIFEKLVDHPRITVKLNTPFSREMCGQFDHVFYSGTLDGFFDYHFGYLPYRTLRFEEEIHDGDYLGCPVMNFGDEDIPYTRICEHKFFTDWEDHDRTVIYREYSEDWRPGAIPYYPIRLTEEEKLLARYVELASQETTNVTFLGRLGTFRYLDMDQTVAEALTIAERFCDYRTRQEQPPPFIIPPVSAH